jgi:hypothetical protein
MGIMSLAWMTRHDSSTMLSKCWVKGALPMRGHPAVTTRTVAKGHVVLAQRPHRAASAPPRECPVHRTLQSATTAKVRMSATVSDEYLFE